MADDIKKYLDEDGLKHYNDKLQAQLTAEFGKKVDATKLATTEEFGLVKIGDGIAVSDGVISAKPKSEGSVVVTDEGIDVDYSKGTKATAGTLGLVKVGNGLDVIEGEVSVKPYENGAIQVNGDGVSINLKDNAGLEITTNELGVKAKASGGVSIDSNGLSVDWQNGPRATADQYGLIKLGAGLKTGDDGTIQVDAENVVAGSVNWSDIVGTPDDLVYKRDLVSVYEYTGSVASYDNLPTNLTDADKGHVYNVEDTGMNYAWAGKESPNADPNGWDPLGMSFTINSISTEDIDKLFED